MTVTRIKYLADSIFQAKHQSDLCMQMPTLHRLSMRTG